MSPDQLTQREPGPHDRAVLAVLAGRPLTEAADDARMNPVTLSDAVRVFQQAGHEALAQHTAQHEWWHVYLHFADWASADQTFTTHVLPLLKAAEIDGSLDGWWYTRKHPCWRLRLHRNPRHETTTPIGDGLSRLVTNGHLTRWWPGIYEPETAAFGGPASMDAAHRLFVTDSREIQQLPSREDLTLGPREVSVLLCTILMRSAGLEWYEQGDVWHRVITAEHRSAVANVPAATLHGLAADIRTLLVADVSALLNSSGPLAPITEWATAFSQTGRALAEAGPAGTLDRGLRQVLSYHVIFHWNRLGLSIGSQSALAWAARAAILDLPEERSDGSSPAGLAPTGAARGIHGIE
jgi:thiopeptide-type bacteriocin biosynthesis protein